MPITRLREIDTEPSLKSVNRRAASSLRRAPNLGLQGHGGQQLVILGEGGVEQAADIVS